MSRGNKEWYSKYVFAALRRIWRWSPQRKLILKKAWKCDGHEKPASQRCKKCRWACFKCKKLINAKAKQVDHTFPVVDPVIGFVDWNTYIKRLLEVPVGDLAVMCKNCHQIKSATENEVRRRD